MGILLLAYIIFSFAVFLFLIAIDLLHMLRKQEPERDKPRYEPKVLVIVPCRGRDLTLERNLISIKSQRYRDFGILAVVDDVKDSAAPILKSTGINFIVSGGPRGRASGKVAAILDIVKRFRDYPIYVVADSDIEVDQFWLKNLISPLADSKVGISTMFPYFNPHRGFWSKVKMVWGFVGESLLESESSRFGWGGALAFRRELADKWFIDLATKTRFGVSDDICLTMSAKQKGMRIAYTSESQPHVNSDDNFARFAEWANRQTALTLLGYSKNLYLGLVYYSSEIVLFLSGIVLTLAVSPVFLVYFLHLLRSYSKTYRRSMRAYPELLLIVPMMPFLYLANLLVANRMQYISWRGRRYPLKD